MRSASLENILQPWGLVCYNLLLPNLSLNHRIAANLCLGMWLGPYGIGYSSYTRAPPVSKSSLLSSSLLVDDSVT